MKTVTLNIATPYTPEEMESKAVEALETAHTMNLLGAHEDPAEFAHMRVEVEVRVRVVREFQ
ncbi:hypothetical protein WK13_34690 [Burkholderia ubonensis]|uniref:hypothetical protein n=1 Tax=Burkholderia ubonensis TaxID=101571 RepID=UPI00075E2E11|nr:hypothetical protein [Burkholderia ubonensis]KVR21688.1 hypothetical protein WK13_34690 [Burkholderia ubonensis]